MAMKTMLKCALLLVLVSSAAAIRISDKTMKQGAQRHRKTVQAAGENGIFGDLEKDVETGVSDVEKVGGEVVKDGEKIIGDVESDGKKVGKDLVSDYDKIVHVGTHLVTMFKGDVKEGVKQFQHDVANGESFIHAAISGAMHACGNPLKFSGCIKEVQKEAATGMKLAGADAANAETLGKKVGSQVAAAGTQVKDVGVQAEAQGKAIGAAGQGQATQVASTVQGQAAAAGSMASSVGSQVAAAAPVAAAATVAAASGAATSAVSQFPPHSPLLGHHFD